MNIAKYLLHTLILSVLVSCANVQESVKQPSSNSEAYIDFVQVVSQTLSEAIPETETSVRIALAGSQKSRSLESALRELQISLSELKSANKLLLAKNYNSAGLAYFNNAPRELAASRTEILDELSGIKASDPTVITLGDISKLLEFIIFSTTELNHTLAKVAWVPENA